MNYYYDIYLNFTEENLMFYEWDELDNIEYIKKIPFFHVNSKVLKDFINYKVKVNKNFLEIIYNKTKSKSDNLNYCAIFADNNGAIALEFNDEGEVISRSFLEVEDEINIIELLFTTKMENIEYERIKKINYNDNLRIEDKIKKVIATEIKSLSKQKDYLKLKYLYFEWFNKFPINNDELTNNMLKALNKDITEKEINIYNLIKLSYSQV